MPKDSMSISTLSLIGVNCGIGGRLLIIVIRRIKVCSIVVITYSACGQVRQPQKKLFKNIL